MSSDTDLQVAASTPHALPHLDAAAAAVADDCARWAKRRPSHARASIQSPDMAQPMPCTMRNSSSTGALLELIPGQPGARDALDRLPDTFLLYLPMERVAIDCRLVWRQGQKFGVQYASPARPIAKAAPSRLMQKPAKPASLVQRVLKGKL